jgi:hypothetical protein
MPLSAAQYQALITVEVGDVDGIVAGQISTLWLLYDSQADLYLRYLYAKRKSIDVLMGHVREQVTRRGLNDVSADLTDKLKNLQIMYGNVDREITKLEAKAKQVEDEVAQSGGQPVIGDILAPAPPAWGPDGNDPIYRGSPYGRRRL